MLYLKPNPSLHDFQQYVAQLEIERGFTNETLVQKCLLLTEELGELFERIDQPASHHLLAEELADVLIYLCAITTRLAVNLDEALSHENGLAVSTPLTTLQQQLGIPTTSLASLGLQLGVTIGKQCKAIRKLENVKVGTHSKEVKLQPALVATVLALCAVANKAGVNLEQSFRDKEEINKTRTWTASGKIEAHQ